MGRQRLGDTKVKLDKLVFKQTIDVETARQAFEAGEGDDAPVPAGKYADAQAAYPEHHHHHQRRFVLLRLR